MVGRRSHPSTPWALAGVLVTLLALLASLALPTRAAASPAPATVASATAAATEAAAAGAGRCTGDLTLYGLRSDGRLTVSVVDPATGRLRSTAASSARLGFEAQAWTMLDARTILVTAKATGALWRVDVTATAPLTFVRTRLASSGWPVTFLAADGAGHLYGYESSRIVRWSVSGTRPTAAGITGRTVIGWIGKIKTLTASGADHLYVTTTTGRLVELSVDAAGRLGRIDVATSGWDDRRHVVSPGGGLVYAVAWGTRTMSWYARTASGFAAQPDAVGASWGQVRLSVAQAPCVTTLPVETDCTLVSTSTPQQYTVLAAGFRVHPCVADRVERMVAAARAAGFALGGSAWRDTATQIALRKQNCGTSQYAIWEMPSSECTPPTARPGTSQHERGLALDLTLNGRSLTSTSPAFTWLKANAATYGFANLPSEPWHWSTTGW
ncbi:D-alanyl-D-alanine carboxypeptidase family protein [Cellulomonas composti]|uniref:Uncharacterized protein n=1 Tax=Cellulomonas composti TaxID=266130 RepID=A0A511JBI0_9CELL|nr:D-alanyl-D-alanine carboxypeptidase family protein [Cellulomonas composti]GEL95159.1 hypothetical protein CCO02nite_18170 [Cellulomonas composti]